MSIVDLTARRSLATPADADRFWGIVESSHAPDEPKQLELLADALIRLDDQEAVDFIALFDDAMAELDTPRLRAAASLMNGEGGDEEFVAFRHWLIARGRAIAETAREDPDALARFDVAIGTARFEWFGAVMIDDYVVRSGGTSPARTSAVRRAEPAASGDAYELRANFPRLAARFLA